MWAKEHEGGAVEVRNEISLLPKRDSCCDQLIHNNTARNVQATKCCKFLIIICFFFFVNQSYTEESQRAVPMTLVGSFKGEKAHTIQGGAWVDLTF